MKKRALPFAALLLLFFSSYGQVPGTLSYQGIFMQADGVTPIADGSHTIVFSFYTVSSGGSALFTRTVSVSTVKGLYTCIIGGGSAPNAAFNSTEMNQLGSQQVYVGVALDGGAELSPRAQLTTTPYSLYSANSAKATAVTQTANPTGGAVAFWGTNNTLGTDNGLYWDNTNKMLGIGTTSPSRALYVAGQIEATGAIIADGGLSGQTLTTSGAGSIGKNISIYGTASPTSNDAATGSESIIFMQRGATGGVKNSNTAEIKLSTMESGILGRTLLGFWLSGLPQAENNFGTVAEVPVLTLQGYDGGGTSNIGRVGIGTQVPSNALSVNGDADKASGGSTWSLFSDVRLKENVKDFTDGLSVLKQIHPKTFRYNGLGGIPKSQRNEIGIIAQELQPVAPYMIKTVSSKLYPTDKENTDLLMFDGGSSLIYVLVNSVKEQQTQIDDLKKEVAELRRLLELVKAAQNTPSTGR